MKFEIKVNEYEVYSDSVYFYIYKNNKKLFKFRKDINSIDKIKEILK